MENGFNRKIFTLVSFIQAIGYVILNVPSIIGALRSKYVYKSFGEKIMLVTTAVNGCIYCEWFHAKIAATSGMKDEEIKNLLDLQFQTNSTDYELPALLFAQHYAETNKHPDQKMVENLKNFYGQRVTKDIYIYIELMFIGNLTGNTFDAFLSRLKGQKAPHSNLLFELVFFIVLLPVMVPILLFAKLSSPSNGI